MNNAVYGKTMKLEKQKTCNLKLVNNKKDYLKWTAKRSYLTQKIFDNHLVAVCKNKVTLTLNKPAYICVYKMQDVYITCIFKI